MSKKINKNSNASDDDKKFPLPIYDQEDDIYSKEKEVPLKRWLQPPRESSTETAGME